MTNPLRGVLLEGRFYDYVSNSYRVTLPLKNDRSTTQDSNTFTVLGADKRTHVITLDLSNTTKVKNGETTVGTTTWLGVSRLADLENFIGAKGVSMPITFVSTEGITRSVVPTGQLDIQMFNPANPEEAGVEYRVTLTLSEV